jgi:hypothetical protein
MSELSYFISNNEWYLKNAEKCGEKGYYYYKCIYSNGIAEAIITIKFPEHIPVVMDNQTIFNKQK